MLGGDLCLLEGGTDLAGSLLFTEVADLDVNGGGTHDDQEGNAAEDDPGMATGFWAERPAGRRGCLHSGQTKGAESSSMVMASLRYARRQPA